MGLADGIAWENEFGESKCWVEIEYIGEDYNIADVFRLCKGMKSGLPLEVWEKEKDNLPDWRIIE